MAQRTNPSTFRRELIYEILPAKSLRNVYGGITLPQNPGLADNNWSGGHQDSYCSESVGLTGPTSKELKLIIQHNPFGCIPIMSCNRNNQFIGVSFEAFFTLVVFDKDCHILSATRFAKHVKNSFAGGYFYMDKDDNAIVMGNNKAVCFPTANVEKKEEIYRLDPLWTSDDIAKLVTGKEDGNVLYSVLPVWHTEGKCNLYWCLLAGAYIFKQDVHTADAHIAVVQIDPDKSQPHGCTTTLIDSLPLEKQWINNTFAVDERCAYFVTNAMDEEGVCTLGYLHAVGYDPNKKKVYSHWAYPYKNCGLMKPGLVNVGSGTTPTLLDSKDGRKLVTIADNANPYMNVVVCDRDTGELVCEVPVLAKMRGCDEASLIGVNNRIVVENNFGHTLNFPHSQLIPNEPGMEMVEVVPAPDKGGEVVWRNTTHAFFAMSMLARESGIIFAHMGDWSHSSTGTEGAEYSIVAMDAWDGRIIWRIPLGRGIKYCHEYGGIYFDRTGKSIYLGTTRFIVSVQEADDALFRDLMRTAF